MLRRSGGCPHEQAAVYAKLAGDTEPDIAQSEALERWLVGTDDHTIGTRLEVAADAWGDLWTGGIPDDVREAEPLAPIIGDDIAKILRRQGGGMSLQSRDDGET